LEVYQRAGRLSIFKKTFDFIHFSGGRWAKWAGKDNFSNKYEKY
jgi:hypothetical protein